MEIQFVGKRALVTGAGKGIGRDIAKRFVELGADTVALSRTQSDLDSLKAEVPAIKIVQCDLRDWDRTRQSLQTVGDIDLLVNNAGVSRIGPFLDVKEEDIDWMFDINYKALFNVGQVIARSMVDRKTGGAIVNVSSASTFHGLEDHAVYSSTKAAVDKLTHIMALELGKHKIRVNAVNPTVALTDMGKVKWSDPINAAPMIARIPMGRFIDVSEIVNAIMFLLSDKATMIHGITLPIDGGLLTT